MTYQFLKSILLILAFFLALNSFSQIDGSNGSQEKGKKKTIILNNSKEVKKPEAVDLDGTDGFKSAFEKEKEKLKKLKELDSFNKKGLITKELDRKIKFQKFIEKNTLQIPMIDKDIGIFRTKSLFINLFCFDFGQIDGDIITVLKNGKPFMENINLLAAGKIDIIKIPLDIGFNKIEILAVNEGGLRPNTGAFTLFDDFKREVFSDFWNLAKGAKVIALIIREPKDK